MRHFPTLISSILLYIYCTDNTIGSLDHFRDKTLISWLKWQQYKSPMFAVCLNHTLLVLCADAAYSCGFRSATSLSLCLRFFFRIEWVSPLPALPAPGKKFRPVRLKMFWHSGPTILNIFENYRHYKINVMCFFELKKEFFSNLLAQEKIVEEKLGL
jgi:hypothetical protein